jgi:hypothetical protein
MMLSSSLSATVDLPESSTPTDHAEMVHTADCRCKYGAINRGEMYEIAQGNAGVYCSPMPEF